MTMNTRNDDGTTSINLRSNTLYETMQIDCLEYLCYSAIFNDDTTSAATSRSVVGDVSNSTNNSTNLNSSHSSKLQSVQDEIQQCLENIVLWDNKKRRKQAITDVAATTNNPTDVIFNLQQYNTNLYKWIQLTALYYDSYSTFDLSITTTVTTEAAIIINSNNSSPSTNLQNTNGPKLPSSRIVTAINKQLEIVSKLLHPEEEEEEEEIATTNTNPNEQEESSDRILFRNVQRTLQIITALLQLRERLIRLQNATDGTNNSSNIDFELAVDDYNQKLVQIFTPAAKAVTDKVNNDGDVKFRSGNNKSSNDRQEKELAQNDDDEDKELKAFLDCNDEMDIDGGAGVSGDDDDDDEDEDDDDDDENGDNERKKNDKKNSTNSIPRNLVSFLLNDMYHAGRRRSLIASSNSSPTEQGQAQTTTTTTETSSEEPAAQLPTTPSSTAELPHHASSSSTTDLSGQIIKHIENILLLSSPSTQSVISNIPTASPTTSSNVDGPSNEHTTNYSIPYLHGLIRTLLRFWAVTKLDTPTLMSLGYHSNKATTEQKQDLLISQSQRNTIDSTTRSSPPKTAIRNNVGSKTKIISKESRQNRLIRNAEFLSRKLTRVQVSGHGDSLTAPRTNSGGGKTSKNAPDNSDKQKQTSPSTTTISNLGQANSVNQLDGNRTSPKKYSRLQIRRNLSEQPKSPSIGTKRKQGDLFYVLKDSKNDSRLSSFLIRDHSLFKRPTTSEGAVRTDHSTELAKQLLTFVAGHRNEPSRPKPQSNGNNKNDITQQTTHPAQFLRRVPEGESDEMNNNTTTTPTKQKLNESLKSPNQSSSRKSTWKAEAKRRYDRHMQRKTITEPQQDSNETPKKKKRTETSTSAPVVPNDSGRENSVESPLLNETSVAYRSPQQENEGSNNDNLSTQKNNEIAKAVRRGFQKHGDNWMRVKMSNPVLQHLYPDEIHFFYRKYISLAKINEDKVDRLDFADDDSLFYDSDDHVNSPPTRKRNPFTDNEVQAIRDGIKKFGVGKWADIQRNDPRLKNRNQGQIKDKFRHMVTHDDIDYDISETCDINEENENDDDANKKDGDNDEDGDNEEDVVVVAATP